MAEDRCPRCFSKIGIIAPLWTNDPLKTPKGIELLPGLRAYKGFTYIKPEHIEELQEARKQQEIDAGIAEEDRTTFTPVRVEGQKVYFYKKHLRELRESTEKILTATGQTKETYFNYDDEGTEYNIGDHQLDWHDVNLDQKFLDIKAVHIEDLRHYLITLIPIYFSENWSNAEEKYYFNLGLEDGSISAGENIQGTDNKIWTVLGRQYATLRVNANRLIGYTSVVDIETGWNSGWLRVSYVLPTERIINNNTKFTMDSTVGGAWYNYTYDNWIDNGYYRVIITTNKGTLFFGIDSQYTNGRHEAIGTSVYNFLPISFDVIAGYWFFDMNVNFSNVNLLSELKLIDSTINNALVLNVKIEMLSRDSTTPALNFDTYCSLNEIKIF